LVVPARWQRKSTLLLGESEPLQRRFLLESRLFRENQAQDAMFIE